MGILNWLLKYRREMAEKFAQFGDAEFSQITQTWLHQWTRNVMLGDLDINGIPQDQLAVLNRNHVPANITGFSSIRICNSDPETLGFLGKVHHLFSNVSLMVVDENAQRSKTIFRHLLPLTDGIEAIHISDAHPELPAFFADEFQTQFYETGFLEVRSPNEEFPKEDNPISRWLFSPRKNGQPKTLIMHNCFRQLEEMVQHIRQHFLNPLIDPLCFFVRIWALHLDTVESTTIQNENGEQLIVRKDTGSSFGLLIIRCPSDVDGEWLAQKLQEMAKFDEFDYEQKRLIILSQNGDYSSDSGSEDTDDSSLDASTNSSGIDEPNDGDADKDEASGGAEE